MATRLYYQQINWKTKRNEITFIGAYLSNGRGKKFQVDGLKRIVAKNEELYLCKIQVKMGRHVEDTFKFLVLDEEMKSHREEKDIQLVGRNKDGYFCLDKEFAEGMKKVNSMEKIDKISLSDMRNEREANNKGS